MARLNPEAEKLVNATRSVLRPNSADRERVFQALLPKLGGGLAAEGMNVVPHAKGAARGMLMKVSAVVVGLGVAGGGLFLASRPAAPPAKPIVAAPQKPAPAPAEPVNNAPPIAVPASPETDVAEKRAPVPSRSADNLAQEVAILSRAGAELHAGQPAAALKTLEEHQRKFPGGVLTQERTAARIQALCALGRTREAQSELSRLSRSAPESPHVARASKACGLTPDK